MDYRELIKAEFHRRRISDPFYSLRTFAKDLGLSPIYVSYLLRFKRGLSKHNALPVAHAMGLNGSVARRFCLLVNAQSARTAAQRNVAKQGLQKKFIKEAESELIKRLQILK